MPKRSPTSEAARSPGWLTADVPKGRPIMQSTLGQVRETQLGKPLALDEAGLRRAAHARCVEHVRVEGLRTPVCIPRGADRAAVLAEAVELSGSPDPF